MAALSHLLRPATVPLRFALGAERRARHVAEEAAARLALTALDAALASRTAEQAIDRIVASALVERAVSRALRGPLVEAIGRDLARYEVMGRAAQPLLEGPELERVVASAIDSHLMEETVARLLESEELWLLVDEIARSPSVTDAIGQQGIGFADQVAGVVRQRTRGVDDRLERAARRLVRRNGAPRAPEAG